MIEALEEQRRSADIAELDFEQRLALLVERQWLWKSNRALAARLQQSQLKMPASLEDIDCRHPRGPEARPDHQLRVNDWIGPDRACLITGPTGCGKTYLACALGDRRLSQGSSHALLPRPETLSGLPKRPGRWHPAKAAQAVVANYLARPR